MSISVNYWLPDRNQSSKNLLSILEENFDSCKEFTSFDAVCEELNKSLTIEDKSLCIYLVECGNETAAALARAPRGRDFVQIVHGDDEIPDSETSEQTQNHPGVVPQIPLDSEVTKKHLEKLLVDQLENKLLRHHVRVLHHHFVDTWNMSVDKSIQSAFEEDPLEERISTTWAKALAEFKNQIRDGFEELEAMVQEPNGNPLQRLHVETTFQNAAEIIDQKRKLTEESDVNLTIDSSKLELAFCETSDTFLDFTFLHMLASMDPSNSGKWERRDDGEQLKFVEFKGDFNARFRFRDSLTVDEIRDTLNTKEKDIGVSHAVLLRKRTRLFARMKMEQLSQSEKFLFRIETSFEEHGTD